MIRHCVMFNWNDDVSAEAKAAVSAGLDEMAKLDGVAAYSHGPDAGISDGNWDYVVVADFADPDTYSAYATNVDHVALIQTHIKPNISARAAVQFDI